VKISDEKKVIKTNEAAKKEDNKEGLVKKVELANKSDWDDSRFSDIDDDNDENLEIAKSEPALAKPKPVIESKISKEEYANKPQTPPKENPQQFQPQQQKQQQQSSWSWSKLGTNLISTAANLTSQMIETVEATLGAPDPSELAAKIAKSQSEYQFEEKKSNLDDEKPQSKDDNSWNFENENEWFTINKIASTVRIYL
jgi:hypothetical protein